MRKLIIAFFGSALGSLLLVASVFAADPTPSPSAIPTATPGTVASTLGLTQAQIQDLRHDGLSLAQIAAQQKVQVQTVIDALVARWRDRIEARQDVGALTPDEAVQLQTQLQTQAQEMVQSTNPGGMQGEVVGAGPENAGNGNGTDGDNGANGYGPGDGTGTGEGGPGPYGTGDCDGTGPHGPSR
jgi:hypothetical protein